MARYDVYRRRDGSLLLDVRANTLDSLNVRIMVPLMLPPHAPLAATRLNPSFRIEEHRHVMMTQYIGSMRDVGFDDPILNLTHHHDDIVAALDMLFHGF